MDDQKIHEVIGTMDDFERGWYHACITTLWWNAAHQPVEMRMPVDYDEETKQYLITKYSPSGSNVPAPSFYQEGRLADDAKSYYFDAEKFEAVWEELDAEASLMYYRLYDHHGKYFRELVIQMRSTEDPEGLPNDWDLYPTDTPDPEERVEEGDRG